MGTIRILLAISVILAHSSSIFGFKLVGGQLAVQAFYIISGFYMTLILNEKYIGKNNSFKLFISNRLLRLYPIYWIVLLLTALHSIIINVFYTGVADSSLAFFIDYYNTMSFSSFIFLIFTNLFLFLQDSVMFLGLDSASGHLFFTQDFAETNPILYQFLFLPQAWTIGVEIAFYLIAPFIVRRKLKLIISLIILSISLRFVLYFIFGLNHDPWTYRFFPTELVFFMLGIIAYKIYKRIGALKFKNIHFTIIWGAILVFTLFYSFIALPAKEYFYLMMIFISIPFVFTLTKKLKFDNYIGELSYPIYISHIFVLTCMRDLKITFYEGEGLALTVLTLIFSLVLNEVVSKKVEVLRQKRLVSFK